MQSEQGWGDIHPRGSTKGHIFIHIPEGGELRLSFLGHSPTRYEGHWIGKGLKPCIGQSCRICSRGIGTQLRFVFAVLDVDIGHVGLFEIGERTAYRLKRIVDERGYMRGLTCRFWKAGGHQRGGIEIEEINFTGDSEDSLPDDLEIGKILEEIWAKT